MTRCAGHAHARTLCVTVNRRPLSTFAPSPPPSRGMENMVLRSAAQKTRHAAGNTLRRRNDVGRLFHFFLAFFIVLLDRFRFIGFLTVR